MYTKTKFANSKFSKTQMVSGSIKRLKSINGSKNQRRSKPLFLKILIGFPKKGFKTSKKGLKPNMSILNPNLEVYRRMLKRIMIKTYSQMIIRFQVNMMIQT